MLPRFVTMNRTDVVVLSGLRGQVSLQLVYPYVTIIITLTPINTTTIIGTLSIIKDRNNSPTVILLTIETHKPNSSSWPILILSPLSKSSVPGPDPSRTSCFVLSIGCAITGKGFLVDAITYFMSELSHSSSILRAMFRHPAAAAVVG